MRFMFEKHGDEMCVVHTTEPLPKLTPPIMPEDEDTARDRAEKHKTAAMTMGGFMVSRDQSHEGWVLELYRDILAIPGVVAIRLTADVYQMAMLKGRLFDWDLILPKVPGIIANSHNEDVGQIEYRECQQCANGNSSHLFDGSNEHVETTASGEVTIMEVKDGKLTPRTVKLQGRDAKDIMAQVEEIRKQQSSQFQSRIGSPKRPRPEIAAELVKEFIDKAEANEMFAFACLDVSQTEAVEGSLLPEGDEDYLLSVNCKREFDRVREERTCDKTKRQDG